jgi:S1-C subfamily serine protease
VQNLTAELAGAFAVEAGSGVLVAEVAAGSAAEDAGLQPGDVIVRMENRDINSAQDFHNAEGRLALGESLKIEFLREGKIHDKSLVIQSVPVLIGADLDFRLEGARFTGLTAKRNQQNLSGVLLDELTSGSRLARAGLAEGDIITGVNRQRVHNLADFQQALEKKRSSILFQIRRRGRAYIAQID